MLRRERPQFYGDKPMKLAPLRDPLLYLLLPLAAATSASACGGRLAAEEGMDRPSPTGVPAAKAPTERTPTITEYCSALPTSQCGDGVCVSDSECRKSYANASDPYLRAVLACRQVGELGCGYPDPCVAERVNRAPATGAQLALASAYCRACSPGADLEECRTAALRPEDGGETLSLALRVLTEANAERALECETNSAPASGTCENSFVTCLAKYRPIPAYTACGAPGP